MEVTGQAFEDMQEQNSRLIQQLREKDDANFKLMSDRIKANQMHKLLREEKQLLEDQVSRTVSMAYCVLFQLSHGMALAASCVRNCVGPTVLMSSLLPPTPSR